MTEEYVENMGEVLSDEEWEDYINGLIEAHRQGVCNPATCAQCIQPGDPLENWLS